MMTSLRRSIDTWHIPLVLPALERMFGQAQARSCAYCQLMRLTRPFAVRSPGIARPDALDPERDRPTRPSAVRPPGIARPRWAC